MVLVGQLFPAILLARLVSMDLYHRQTGHDPLPAGPSLDKIAVVGDSEREDDVLMFAAAPLRAGRVRYLSSEREAGAWLNVHY